MMFKNSLKLFVANFSVFWKLLLYKIIAIGVCVLLLIPVIPAWESALSQVSFVEQLTNFATNTVFSSTAVFLRSLFILVDTFVSAVGILFASSAISVFYSAFVVLFLLPILFGLSSIPTGEGLYSYMASLSKSSFTATFISKIGSSFVYSILRTLIVIPVVAIICVCLYFLLSLSLLDGILQVFLPIIVILFFVISVSVLITILCGWLPATVVFNAKPIKGFKKGLKAVFRKFFRLLSSVLVIIFFTTMLSFMFTTFSLIALIPLASVSIIMLEMVMFFESQGMRYYVDLDTIVTPKKLEQCDKFNKVKNII